MFKNIEKISIIICELEQIKYLKSCCFKEDKKNFKNKSRQKERLMAPDFF